MLNIEFGLEKEQIVNEIRNKCVLQFPFVLIILQVLVTMISLHLI